MFMGISVYLAVFFLSPLEVQVSIEPGSFFYIGSTVIALVMGSRLASRVRLGSKPFYITSDQLKRSESRLFWAMLWLGGSGHLFKMFDKYVLRGVGGLTGLEAREVLLDSGSGPLSVIGGFLYPFGYIPIFILLGAKVLKRTRWKIILACVVFLVPAVDAILLFSRSFMLVTLAMIYFGTSVALFKGRAMPRKVFFPLLASVSLVLSLSMYIFALRLQEMGIDISFTAYLSGYAYTVKPNATGAEIVEMRNAFSLLIPIAQYYVHSLLEFQILWSVNNVQDFSWGALLFAPYVKFLSLFGIASEPDLFALFPRVGVFTSFWGPFWVDFGWFGSFIMFFVGFMMRSVGRAARRGEVGAYPLYTYFCVILLFMPLVNFAISAQGMYTITAFVLFWLMSRKISRAVPI